MQGQNTRGSDQRFLAAIAWSHAAPGADAGAVLVLASSSDARLQLLAFRVRQDLKADSVKGSGLASQRGPLATIREAGEFCLMCAA